MKNPFAALRELTSLSQRAFAEKYGFSRTAITFVESGQLNEISDDLNKSLGLECAEKGIDARAILAQDYNAQTLQQAYQTWKSNERTQVAHLFQVPLSGQHDKQHSPFYYYIRQVASSEQAFCKLLKVPSATVLRYRDGDTRTMPKTIEDALREVSFPYMSELLGLQLNWWDENKA